ncbi:hypothetical protein [Nostoc sp.]|uniref:hypothetical protein n=1 Tax=Nostoc sp. TaxID=1180 RepID=UPI002FFA6188
MINTSANLRGFNAGGNGMKTYLTRSGTAIVLESTIAELAIALLEKLFGLLKM